MHNLFSKKAVKCDSINDLILQRIAKTENLLENNDNRAFEYFFNTVKMAFAEIFDITFQFTFEELIHKLNNIDKNLQEINDKINKIKKEITEISHKKPRGRPKQFKEKIDSLNLSLTREMELEKKYIHLNSVLLDTNLKNKIFLFSKRISNLRYSKSPVSKEELHMLIGVFKEILSHFTVQNTPLIKKNIFSMQGLLNKSLNIFKKNKLSYVLNLLERAKKQLDKNDIVAAKNCYLRIMKIYPSLSNEETKEVHLELVNLFNLIKCQNSTNL